MHALVRNSLRGSSSPLKMRLFSFILARGSYKQLPLILSLFIRERITSSNVALPGMIFSFAHAFIRRQRAGVPKRNILLR